MTKRELTARVAKKLGRDHNEIDHVVNVLFDTMVETWIDGEEIHWYRFGIFAPKTYVSGRTQAFGRAVHKEPRTSVRFFPSNYVLSKVNGRRSQNNIEGWDTESIGRPNRCARL